MCPVGSQRSLIGRLLLILGLALVVWRGSIALHSYREWQRTRVTDPSAAEVYEDSFWVEMAFAGMGAALLAAGVWLAGHRRTP
jgi:hypothetical protein